MSLCVPAAVLRAFIAWRGLQRMHPHTVWRLRTAPGAVPVQNGTDVKAALSCENGLSVVSLCCYSKGFVAGQDGGVVTIFEKDEKEFYRRARAFTIENNNVKVKCAGTAHVWVPCSGCTSRLAYVPALVHENSSKARYVLLCAKLWTMPVFYVHWCILGLPVLHTLDWRFYPVAPQVHGHLAERGAARVLTGEWAGEAAACQPGGSWEAPWGQLECGRVA